MTMIMIMSMSMTPTGPYMGPNLQGHFITGKITPMVHIIYLLSSMFVIYPLRGPIRVIDPNMMVDHALLTPIDSNHSK